MNEQARKHVAAAREHVSRGEKFYRKAAEEIVAAKAEGASWTEIGDELGRNKSWAQKIVAWAESPANTASRATPFTEEKGAQARRHTKADLRTASVEEIAEDILSDPDIRTKVSRSLNRAADQQEKGMRERELEREIERKGGKEEHAEYLRSQQISDLVDHARGLVTGARYVAHWTKELGLSGDDETAEELLRLTGETEGFLSLLRSYLSGGISDEDIAALLQGDQ